ncbi:hypothetical protein Tco_0856160 [Tanacetum coccineum]
MAVVDSSVNQHLTYTDKYLVNVIDISKLRIKVSHPNGIEAHITKWLETVNFLIDFDESDCYVLPQDLREMKLLRIGRQKGGLYYFNGNQVVCDDPGVPYDEQTHNASSQNEGGNSRHYGIPNY